MDSGREKEDIKTKANPVTECSFTYKDNVGSPTIDQYLLKGGMHLLNENNQCSDNNLNLKQ
jgi:hypothetical protein